MGIRFACFECKKSLNIKAELAGKRGVCPQCGTRFRIPDRDTDYAIPIDETNQRLAASVQTYSVSDQVVGQESYDPSLATGTAVSAAGGTVATEQTAVGSAAEMPIGNHNGRSNLPSLLSDAQATWYVRPPSGGQYGPATGDILRQWISEGRLTHNTLIWRDGWAQWRAADEVLVEFGASPRLTNAKATSAPSGSSVAGEAAVANTSQPSSLSSASYSTRQAADMLAKPITGDAQIGVRKSQVTQKRVMIVAALTAVSLTMIAILIFLLQG